MALPQVNWCTGNRGVHSSCNTLALLHWSPKCFKIIPLILAWSWREYCRHSHGSLSQSRDLGIFWSLHCQHHCRQLFPRPPGRGCIRPQAGSLLQAQVMPCHQHPTRAQVGKGCFQGRRQQRERTAVGQGQAVAPAGSLASCCGWHKHCLRKWMMFSFGFLLVIWLY